MISKNLQIVAKLHRTLAMQQLRLPKEQATSEHVNHRTAKQLGQEILHDDASSKKTGIHQPMDVVIATLISRGIVFNWGILPRIKTWRNASSQRLRGGEWKRMGVAAVEHERGQAWKLQHLKVETHRTRRGAITARSGRCTCRTVHRT
jgi:hypothetical protein